jgi:hypothetical protein
MKSIDATRLEILKMARELTVNEYIDRRAQEHNEWLDKSTELWKTQRLTLAYPVIPPYPTEKEIIARAKILMDFLLTYETKEDFSESMETVDIVNSDDEFVSEAEYSDLSTVVTKTLDKSFGTAPNDEKYASKLPQIMKSVQDIKWFTGKRK